ncbi:MAG: NAD-dependent epimerase/dehydratase family protein, partial [Verrucomicrobiaceae bacterium]
MTTKHTALVLGATGIIGLNLLTYLDTRPAWKVKAVSRRAPDFATRAEVKSLDLLSPDSLASAAEWLRDVTHVFFAAYQEHPDAADLTRINVSLLRNVVEALEKHAPGFRHVSFIQGGKAYGAQFGLYKT